MPLSDHEQRLLDQMERALYAEDPKFATSMRNPRTVAGDKRRIALGVVLFFIGVGGLLAGVATKVVLIGAVGFLAMVVGIWLSVGALVSAPKGQAPTAAVPSAPSKPRSTKPSRQRQHQSGSLAERMEERWRRRRENGDF